MARRLIRKRFIVGLVLALLVALALTPNPWRDRAASWGLRQVLAGALGRDIAWKSLRVVGLPPRLEVRGLELTPFVKARFVAIAPSTSLVSSSIFVSGLEVDLSGPLTGGPPKAAKGPPVKFIFFHRLTLTDVTLKLRETTVPLSGDFRQVSLFTMGERGFLWVRSAQAGIRHYPPIHFSLRAGFGPDGAALRLDRLAVRGPDFRITGSGRLAGASPQLDCALSVEAPAQAWLDRFGAGIDFQSEIRLKTALRLEDGRLLIRGDGACAAPVLFHRPLEPFMIDFTLESAGPKRTLDAALRGSAGALEARLDLHPPVRIESRLALQGVGLKRLLETFSVPAPAFDLPVDVRAEHLLFGSAIDDAVGSVTVSDPGGRVRIEAGLRGLGFEAFSVRIQGGGLDLDAAGSLPFNDTDPVEIQGALHRSDLEALQRFLSPFLPDFGALSGCIDGRFTVSRSFSDPLLSVEAWLDQVRLLGLDWGSGPVAFTVTRRDPFAVRGLALALGGGALRARGGLASGFDFQHENWPWTLPFPMTLSGTGHLDLLPAFAVRGEVDQARLPFLPFDLDRVHAAYAFDGAALTLHSLTAGSGEGSFSGSGEFTDAFRLRGTLRRFPLAEGMAADGDLHAEFGAVLTGGMRLIVAGEAPPFPLEVDADLGTDGGRLRVATRGFGVLDARLDQIGGGRLGVEGTLAGIALEGLPAEIDPPANGSLRLAGDPFDPATWSGSLRLPPFELLQGEFRYRVPKGLELSLERGVLSLARIDIEHDWGFLELSGRAQLSEGFPFEADLKADFGDDLVGQLFPDLAYSGFASMDLHAQRRERSLELDGELRVDGYYLHIKPVRLMLEKPEARITFRRNRISLERLDARTGEGTFQAHGEVFLGRRGEVLAANLGFQGEDLLLRYPEGFRFLLDGSGDLVLTPGSKALTAKVVLQEGLYSRDLDLVSELKKAFASEKPLAPASRLPDIRLGVEISIPGTLQFRNQLLEITGSGRLQVTGTLPKPVVLGSLETLPGSRVNFGGVQYQILRASVAFNNPHQFDPILDVLAEATVQSYLIRLALSGPTSRLQTRLTSTPYLTEADIFSLLATGAPGRDGDQVVATGAASLLVSQQLSQRLTRSTSSWLGVDRVRIDPVIGETSITGARLTLAKQITRDCLFSYTYNSDVNKGDIIALECTVAGNAFLNLMQEDDGSYSLQLMKREKF
jgi:hypothetical protein